MQISSKSCKFVRGNACFWGYVVCFWDKSIFQNKKKTLRFARSFEMLF